MRFVILLLVLFTLTSGLIPDKKKPVKNIEWIARGFDIRTGMGNLAPIFQLTYNNGYTWVAPHSGTKYLVPDQFIVSDYPVSKEWVLQSSYRSYHDFLETYKSWFHFDIGIAAGAFSMGFKYDKQLGYVHENMKIENVTLMHGNHFWTYLVGDIYPPELLELNDMLAKEISILPEKISNNRDYQMYSHFVQSF